MKAYAGINLHSTNNYIGIINDKDQRLSNGKKKAPATPKTVTSIFPGHMWKPLIMRNDHIRTHNASSSVRRQRQTVSSLLRH